MSLTIRKYVLTYYKMPNAMVGMGKDWLKICYQMTAEVESEDDEVGNISK